MGGGRAAVVAGMTTPAVVAFGGDQQNFPQGRGRVGGGNAGAFVPPAPPLEAPSAPAPVALGRRNVAITTGDPTRAARLALQQANLDKQFATPAYWGTDKGKAMLDLANQASAPTNRSLADYYQAERAAGIGNQGEIAAALTGGLEGDAARNMEAWAKANPMLAMREYKKRFPAGAPTTGPTEVGDFDWAADAGQAARTFEMAKAEKAGKQFSDLSDLPTGGSVGFSPLPTKQAVAAADGAAPAGLPITGPNDQAILQAMGQGQYFPAEGSPAPMPEQLIREHLERIKSRSSQPRSGLFQ